MSAFRFKFLVDVKCSLRYRGNLFPIHGQILCQIMKVQFGLSGLRRKLLDLSLDCLCLFQAASYSIACNLWIFLNPLDGIGNNPLTFRFQLFQTVKSKPMYIAQVLIENDQPARSEY